MAKVTVYVDDEVWSRFRASVFNRHGSLKVLSREVEESLKSSIAEGDVIPYLEKLRASLKPKSSSRPMGRGPRAEALIRRMRGRRVESIS